MMVSVTSYILLLMYYPCPRDWGLENMLTPTLPTTTSNLLWINIPQFLPLPPLPVNKKTVATTSNFLYVNFKKMFAGKK